MTTTPSTFNARSTAREVIAGHDLHGLDAIVTGGASGIGVETVRALATAGARVVLAARNRTQAEAVAATLRAETPGGGAIEVGALDLASLASVRAFVEATSRWRVRCTSSSTTPASWRRRSPRQRTASSCSSAPTTSATSRSPPACCLRSRPPARRASSRSARSATAARTSTSTTSTSSAAPTTRSLAYGQSKTANALFAVGLTQRHAAEGITSNAVMPGGILTGLQKHMTRESQVALGWFDESGKPNDRFKSTEQGAATSIWAAVATELEGVGGLYLEDCAVAPALVERAPDERLHAVRARPRPCRTSLVRL